MSGELTLMRHYFPPDTLAQPLPDTLELLNADSLDAAPDIKQVPIQKPIHSAVHDLEAFHWVLVWLAMSRGGPAASRGDVRRSLSKESKESRKTLSDLFHSDLQASAQEKRYCFLQPDRWLDLLETVLSVYSCDLLDLLSKFFVLLYNAYREHDYDGLHERILEIFEDAEKQLATNPPQYDDETCQIFEELADKERDRRFLDLGRCEGGEESPKVSLGIKRSITPRHVVLGQHPESPTPSSKKPRREDGAKPH